MARGQRHVVKVKVDRKLGGDRVFWAFDAEHGAGLPFYFGWLQVIGSLCEAYGLMMDDIRSTYARDALPLDYLQSFLSHTKNRRFKRSLTASTEPCTSRMATVVGTGAEA
ncbi:hypothetical protein LIA77_08750 [Sarocladium implicatum]|nr:hypothetical protein LIA77_08750 [Sarocladium implicatum]